MAHILIVEDEAKIVSILQASLEAAGHQVSFLLRGDKVVEYVETSLPDLVLLDLMLPGTDGRLICRQIRKSSLVPIIMITAKVDEGDRLEGFSLGADDYVCKPFMPREVVARVNAVLRRTQQETASKKLVIGPIALDEERHELSIRGRVLVTTPKEFTLMKVFMTRPDRVFSRDELINHVFGYQHAGYDRSIDFHIKNLRRKIGKEMPNRDVISTVYGVGYKFCTDHCH